MTKQHLTYYIPKHGAEKVTLTIPESHSLHICPAACGRRNGIRAVRNGEKERVSFLYITQADLISGDYEKLAGDAVEVLLRVLKPRPRVFQLYVNCVDDFLGTDEKALVAGLEERFPECRFAVFRIHPVAADKKIKPGMQMHNQLFTFLRPAEKDNGINLLGNFVSLAPECELFEVLKVWGMGPVRQIFQCRTFEEYSLMAASRVNIVLQEMGTYAAENLQKRLGTPLCFFPAAYRLEEVREYYLKLAGVLCKETPDLQVYEEMVQCEAARTKKAVGDRGIIVDSSASMRPSALARALIEYGFNVKAVFRLHGKDADLPARQWLKENCPKVLIIQREHYQDILSTGLSEEELCIGFDSAYLLRAKHYVDMRHDEGFFGYHGICSLLRNMRISLEHTEEWEAK